VTSIPDLPLLECSSWAELFGEPGKAALEACLLGYVEQRRWFRSKSRARVSGRLSWVEPLAGAPDQRLALFEVDFVEGAPETYLIPLAFVLGPEARVVSEHRAHSVIARVRAADDKEVGLLCDGLASGAALTPLLRLIAQGSPSGTLSVTTSEELRQAVRNLPEPKGLEFEQTNSTVSFGQELVLKIYRQVEAGQNPELEIAEFMSEHPGLPCPRVLGSLSQSSAGKEPRSLGLVQRFVPNQGTAWQFTLTQLEGFFEAVSARGVEAAPAALRGPWSALSRSAPAPFLAELIGPYLGHASLLGTRTAEVHRVLASGNAPAFRPEPFTVEQRQASYERASSALRRTAEALRRRAASVPLEAQLLTARFLGREVELNERLEHITRCPLEAARTRCHGDLHLGQVLFTGEDFVLIDFEGEPARPLRERRAKQSPLCDVMGLIRSFDYATEAVLRSGRFQPETATRLGPWASAWRQAVVAEFLRGYLRAAGSASFIPTGERELDALLDFYELEKVVYEVGYELDNRPGWLTLPLAGIETIFARGLP